MMKRAEKKEDKEAYIQQIVADFARYLGPPLRIMEVCGSHTMAIQKYSIRSLLPPNIKLVSGPGCPVCVTPSSYMEAVLVLSQREEVMFATFGDLLRLPIGEDNLLQLIRNRGNIQIIYSPLECLKLATTYPNRKIIFLAVGFETTAPIVAFLIKRAKAIGLKNFQILCGHRMMPPILEHLSKDRLLKIDGYLYPGHVTSIIGATPYSNIAQTYHIPGVVAGFKPFEIILAIQRLIQLIEASIACVENVYTYAAPSEGNPLARRMIKEVFEVIDSQWRGIGMVPLSGYKLIEKYVQYDAWQDVGPLGSSLEQAHTLCCCNEILKGRLEPYDCKLFAKDCTPLHPVGACMVSSEGTCQAYFKYDREDK